MRKQGIKFPSLEQNSIFRKNGKIDLNSLNQNFHSILTKEEKLQLDEIQIYFQKFERLSNLDYYSLLDALSKFSTEGGYQRSIQRCCLTGIIPSFLNLEMNGRNGTIYAINESQISNLLNKSSNTFSMSFLKANSIMLTDEKARECFGREELLWEKIFSYYQILCSFGYCYKFYFVYDPKSDIQNFELNIYNPTPETESDENKKYPNNIKFLKEWQTSQKLLKKDCEIQNLYKKWGRFMNQLFDLVKILQNIDLESDSSTIAQNLLEPNEKLSMKNLTESKIYSYGTMILDELKKSISVITLNQASKDSLDLNKIVEIIYSGDQYKMDIARNVIQDIVNHKKYGSWQNSKILKIAFLLKYSSSSSYFRLYNLLNKKIPSPFTVESSFRKKILEREQSLIDAKSITTLLDHYWEDIRYRVEDYLN